MKLDAWMKLAGLDDGALAEAVEVDRSTISRVRRRLQRPSWPLMDAIFERSDGAVRPDDFMAGIRSRHAHAGAPISSSESGAALSTRVLPPRRDREIASVKRFEYDRGHSSRSPPLDGGLRVIGNGGSGCCRDRP
jgi:hypothetical protein